MPHPVHPDDLSPAGSPQSPRERDAIAEELHERPDELEPKRRPTGVTPPPGAAKTGRRTD